MCGVSGIISKKNIGDVKVVINGAGASAIACANLFTTWGVQSKNIIMCDRKGVIYKGRKNLDKFKQHLTGIISYYRGAPPQTFPRQNFKVVRCYMNDFQYKSYITSISS